MAAAPSTILPIVAGEPFDLAYLSKIAEFLNGFNTIIAGYDANMLNLNNRITTMGKTKIITKRYRIGEVKKGDHGRHLWNVNFGGIVYKSNPTVMATAYIPTDSQASNSCWITETTTSSTRGKFAFMEGPFNNETVYVDLLIMGAVP